MSRLRLERLGKCYRSAAGSVIAVDQLSLSLSEGELLVLLGASGCGKTTTLKLIAGLENPDGGEILLDGSIVNQVPPEQRPVSVAFQSPSLFPQLTVAENVELGLRLRRVARKEREERVREMLRLLELAELGERLPAQLSGGQQQRVSLARALATSPRVFLLDEPLSSLDPAARVQLRSVIRDLQRHTGTPMIYVTHDQAEALALADRIGVMHRGRIEQVGTPAELYHRPANVFVARFLGTPAMNVLPATVRRSGEGMVCELDGTGYLFPVPIQLVERERKVLLGVRPEQFQIVKDGGLEARVHSVTPAFPEMHLHLEAGSAQFTARVTEKQVSREGETVRVAVLAGQIHLFDAQSECRLEGR